VTRGEPRYVRSIETPVPVPPAFTGLPDRDIRPTAPPTTTFGRRGSVTIDVHGPEDRVKDVSPMREARWPARRVRALRGARRRRSPPRRPPDTPLSSVRPPPRLEPRGTFKRTDRGSRSNGLPRRRPASREPGCLRPSRTAEVSKGSLLSASVSASRSRRPHVYPRLGKVFWMGLASATWRLPA
jgi:hypothetical protein